MFTVQSVLSCRLKPVTSVANRSSHVASAVTLGAFSGKVTSPDNKMLTLNCKHHQIRVDYVGVEVKKRAWKVATITCHSGSTQSRSRPFSRHPRACGRPGKRDYKVRT